MIGDYTKVMRQRLVKRIISDPYLEVKTEGMKKWSEITLKIALY